MLYAASLFNGAGLLDTIATLVKVAAAGVGLLILVLAARRSVTAALTMAFIFVVGLGVWGVAGDPTSVAQSVGNWIKGLF